jgi:hypothetical protein
LADGQLTEKHAIVISGERLGQQRLVVFGPGVDGGLDDRSVRGGHRREQPADPVAVVRDGHVGLGALL